MRIATWNMHYQGRSPTQRQAAWSYLRAEVRADVALVQEAAAPDALLALPIDEVVKGRRWGTTVVSFCAPLRGLATPRSLPAGAAAIGELYQEAAIHPVFVSMYGVQKLPSYAASLGEFVRVLTPVLSALADRPIFLAGDLNVSTQLDRDRRDHADERALRSIEKLGFENVLTRTRLGRSPLPGCRCRGGDACEHVQTHRFRRRPEPAFHIDYFFANAVARKHLRVCELFDREAAWGLSDHCPFVVEWDARC